MAVTLRSGNGFGEEIRIPIPQGVSDADQINWGDVQADGATAFIVSKAGPQTKHYFLTLANGPAAFLLADLDNGFGKRIAYLYRNSTRYSLEDAANGRPWGTRLAMNVAVVSEMRVIDTVSGLVEVSHHQYADGFHDPVEREFRGFGYVRVEEKAEGCAENSDRYEVEPKISEYWNNTGNPGIGRRAVPLPELFAFPADALDPAILSADADTIREARAALRNVEVGQHVSGLGFSGAQEKAYLSSGNNYLITMVQPRLEGHCASFLATRRQSRTVHHDTDMDAPRIEDCFVLEQDEFGNVLLEARVHYPRPGDKSLAEQRRLLLSVEQADYINHSARNAADYHRIGLQSQSRSLEVAGVMPDGDLFSHAELLDKIRAATSPEALLRFGEEFAHGRPQSRPFKWTRSYFWNEERSTPLPLGETAAHGLPHHQCSAVFSQYCVEQVYGGRVSDAMLAASDGAGCGYILEDGYWWMPSECGHFGDAHSYYSLMSAHDALGAATCFEYDPYYIAVTSITDAMGQNTVHEIDYQALAPVRITDINDNVMERVFSPLGQTVAVSCYGATQGRKHGDRSLKNYERCAPKSRKEILEKPEKFLQGAGSYAFIDYFSPVRGEGPACILIVEADRYAVPFEEDEADKRTYDISLQFIDGHGRVLAVQTRVESCACADFRDESDEWTWNVTECTGYGSRGMAVRKYKPFAVSGDEFAAQAAGPCDRFFYDALDRELQCLTAKGFITATQYHPWQRISFDENDTVKDSPYYLANIDNDAPEFINERDALLKAAAFYDTPDTVFGDAAGRDFLTRRICVDNLPGDGRETPRIMESATWRDIAGKPVREADARFYGDGNPVHYNFERCFDMLGRMMTERSSDRGKSAPGCTWFLPRVDGELLRQWDHAGICRRWVYDRLRRPVSVFVSEGEGEFLAQSMVYGDDAQRNNRGRVVLCRDQAQERVVELYGLMGEELRVTVRFPLLCGDRLDWGAPGGVPMSGASWPTVRSLNRRNWLLREQSPNGSVQEFSYYCNGWLESAAISLTDSAPVRTVAREYSYIPSGKKALFLLGNGIRSFHEYDPATLRLSRISARRSTGETVQDMTYWYDPVGNITREKNAAGRPGVSRRGNPEGLRDCHYDSLYRLIQVRGEQHATLSRPPEGAPPELRADIMARIGSDVTRMVPYVETYSFDASGNLSGVRHSAETGGGGGSWVSRLAVSASSNHAVPEEMLESGADIDDYFDQWGNMTRLPNLRAVRYDYRGKMIAATLVERTGGCDDANRYAYDADGERRRRIRIRMLGEGVTQEEESLYVGALVVRRSTRIVDGQHGESAVAVSLRVGAALGENLLLVNEDAGTDAPLLRFQLSGRDGSVSTEYDEAAGLLTWEEYFPYGATAVSLGRKGAVRNKLYRYTGKELDTDTGLYCMGQRYYAPWLGRWLVPDPAGAEGGLNLYAYSKNNPLKYGDSAGTVPVEFEDSSGDADDHRNTLEVDMNTVLVMVQDAQTVLDNAISYVQAGAGGPPPTNWDLVGTYFKITTTTEDDLRDLQKIQDNFNHIGEYLNRDAGKSIFSDKPHFKHVATSKAVASSEAKFGWGLRIGLGLLAAGILTFLGLALGGVFGIITGMTLLGIGGILGMSAAGLGLGGAILALPVLRRIVSFTGITLYTPYWNQSSDDRASTIVHEASHKIVGTDDHAYEYEAEFASLNRREAMDNASSYEAFARNAKQRLHP